jgi:hypothetical protein
MIGPAQVNHYNIEPRMLCVVPTRDGYKSPSRRVPDKNTRLFHGKTLDEWCMIQLRTCKYVDRIIFVCETVEHSMRIQPLAKKYEVQLMVRPRDMLHPVNDTGSLPIFWAVNEAFKSDWWSFVATPFNNTPCRKPGFYDNLVDFYMSKVENPDWCPEAACVVAATKSDYWIGNADQSGRMRFTGQDGYEFNVHPLRYHTGFNHFVAASWWWISTASLAYARVKDGLGAIYSPFIYDIENWEDIHIDEHDDWEAAEFYFKTKILDVYGIDGYEKYAETWRSR